jgi:hypothetical protein
MDLENMMKLGISEDENLSMEIDVWMRKKHHLDEIQFNMDELEPHG